jgi:hypothetical protein
MQDKNVKENNKSRGLTHLALFEAFCENANTGHKFE